MPNRLNPFQQTMAMWEEMHPYNAAHVVHLRGRGNVARLHAAIQGACQMAGVGKLLLDLKEFHYHYEPAEYVELREIKGKDPVIETLRQAVEGELNTPFPDEPHHPVRWLVLDDPKTETHFLVVIYRHLAADGFAMRLLVRRVLNRYFQTPLPGEDGPLQVVSPDYARLMRHHYRRLGHIKAFLRAIDTYFHLRRVHRMRERRDGGERSHSLIFDAPKGCIERLAAACRVRQVTVNDAFMAALCRAMAEVTFARRGQSHRRGLALAAAVDVRDEAREDLSNCFGLFLGQVILIADEPDVGDVEQLLVRTAVQMAREKTRKHFIGPQGTFVILAFLRRWFSLRVTRARYLKDYPVSAGLTNVRLDASWFKGAADYVLNYIRVPPTGPMLPIVLAPTTYSHRLSLGVTYRESSFTEAEARQLIDVFFATLELLSANGDIASSSGWPPH
ncbi:MAG TPA: condensation domain-containing protein [Candidatus Methylomirabilis sp.]|nr:condensation domain-containing protein [Candidatus Methylomirabilis sp.]